MVNMASAKFGTRLSMRNRRVTPIFDSLPATKSVSKVSLLDYLKLPELWRRPEDLLSIHSFGCKKLRDVNAM